MGVGGGGGGGVRMRVVVRVVAVVGLTTRIEGEGRGDLLLLRMREVQHPRAELGAQPLYKMATYATNCCKDTRSACVNMPPPAPGHRWSQPPPRSSEDKPLNRKAGKEL